jgi:hypothetical protein
MRGGSVILPELASVFDECTFLETNIFIKTERRQRAVVLPSGVLKWHRSPTKQGEPIDSLLNDNWQVARAYYENLLVKTRQVRRVA